MKLPRPVLYIGGVLQIEPLGRVQEECHGWCKNLANFLGSMKLRVWFLQHLSIYFGSKLVIARKLFSSIPYKKAYNHCASENNTYNMQNIGVITISKGKIIELCNGSSKHCSTILRQLVGYLVCFPNSLPAFDALIYDTYILQCMYNKSS